MYVTRFVLPVLGSCLYPENTSDKGQRERERGGGRGKDFQGLRVFEHLVTSSYQNCNVIRPLLKGECLTVSRVGMSTP